MEIFGLLPRQRAFVVMTAESIINYKPNDELWFRGLLEDKNGNICGLVEETKEF